MRQVTPLLLAWIAFGLWLACDGAPPPDARPIPAELPAAEREAHRRLPLSGSDNFRDLGGYRTVDDRSVAWGRLYRSDALDDLDGDDVDYLARLDLARVVDFRSALERERDPDRIPEGVTPLWRPISGEGLDPRELSERLTTGEVDAETAVEFLIEGNRAFVTDFGDVYGPFLRELAEPANLPTLFHCTAGKDRAGYAAALTLLAVGVPRDTIMRDYLLTNEFSEAKTRKMLRMIRWISFFRVDPEHVRPLFEARESYLEAAFDTIDAEYGSTEAYLEKELGVDAALRERLRASLLE